MARSGTRLRWQSYSPLIKCRLPGPQLPAQTASLPVRCASAPAANAAVSSCRTGTQSIPPRTRMASVIAFSESPATPWTRVTPYCASTSTRSCATVFPTFLDLSWAQEVMRRAQLDEFVSTTLNRYARCEAVDQHHHYGHGE